MYNANIPSTTELPTSGQLLRSTILAAAAAAILLITTILPAEYGVDPTGIGRTLGLTEMGEIKTQLAEEAEADRAADRQRVAPPASIPPVTPPPDQRSSLFDTLMAPFVIRSASAQTASASRTDEMAVTLEPGEGAEIKLEMKKGAQATFSWTAVGGNVNHDTHGEPDDASLSTHSYKKGRGVSGDEGVLEAVFDGQHGWFWRNRTGGPVTVTLRTSGSYGDIKRVL
jgi:hypothetical protein